jgi:hypothetical protein
LTASCCNDVYTALQELKLTHFWTQGLLPTLLLFAYAFKRDSVKPSGMFVFLTSTNGMPLFNDHPLLFLAMALLFTSRLEHAHYHAIKPAYGAESYLNQGDRKSALFKFYLRSGNFGLNARIHHGPRTPATSLSKSCKLCSDRLIEDEEHFLLHCPDGLASRGE